MNFELSEERQMLQDTLRRFLRDNCSAEHINTTLASELGYSSEVWAGLADMGVLGALFTEDDGGFGGSGLDLSLVFEEIGRVGATEPLIDCALLAGGLVAELGNESQKSRLIEAVIDGSTQLAFAHAEPQSRYDLSFVEATCVKNNEGYALNGQKSVVVNAAAAKTLVVSARSSGEALDESGISLFLVPTDAPGVQIRSYPMITGGHAAEIIFDNVALDQDALLGTEGNAFAAIEMAQARGTVAVCAEAVGLMDTIKELTTEYLKTRKQFGVTIGKFQALQHRMADVLIEIEQARSAVINVAGHLEADRHEREKHVSAAKNLIGNVAHLVAEESIQLHGGIGMTMEYQLGHFAKRLVMIDHRFGDSGYHMERFIQLAVA